MACPFDSSAEFEAAMALRKLEAAARVRNLQQRCAVAVAGAFLLVLVLLG